ncbi:hypothetical protein [Dactylosporangium sp. CA-092794]
MSKKWAVAALVAGAVLAAPLVPAVRRGFNALLLRTTGTVVRTERPRR